MKPLAAIPLPRNVCHRVLAAHDGEGGLTRQEWLKESKLSEKAFEIALEKLCRCGWDYAPVYQSTLNGHYQLSSRFAGIVAKQKGSK